MDNKKVIIIGIILLVIVVGVIYVILNSVDYERTEITPNGTSLDVPARNTKFDGEYSSAKLWHWNNGILITYNSHEDNNIIKLPQIGFYALDEVLKSGEEQDINGFTGYVIDAEELLKNPIFDIIKSKYNGKFYCISLSNDTTHDNIIICCNDKDVAVHMAQSVQYKNVYPDEMDIYDAITITDNISDELESSNISIRNTTYRDVKSSVEEKIGAKLDDAQNKMEQYTGKLPI